MPIIKGFFFDLDGTLVDTYKADFLAYRDAIKDVTGKIIDEEDFAKTHGKEMRQKLTMLGFTHLTEDEILRIAAAKKQHYPTHVHHTAPNTPLLDFIVSNMKDHTMVLVTTAKKQNATLVLARHGIADYFSYMIFGDDLEHPKPHPEAYLKALAATGFTPNEVVAFEDSESGIASAEAAGINVIRIRAFA